MLRLNRARSGVVGPLMKQYFKGNCSIIKTPFSNSQLLGLGFHSCSILFSNSCCNVKYVNHTKLNEALNVFNKMTHERPLPLADEFIRLLRDMKRHDMYFYKTGVVSFKPLFDRFILENRIYEAQGLFKQLAKHELCQLDTVLYNTIIKALCSHPFYNSNASLASKMMDDALKLLIEMLRAYCNAYKMDEAMLLYLEMNERGFKPDHETYSIMIRKLFRVARSGEALKVLEDMRAQGQMLNAFTYFCILNDLINMGHLEEALSLFHFVGDDGKLNSNISVFYFLINAAFVSKKPHIATELFEDLSVKGMKPDLDTYTAMIAGFCGEGLMKDAKHLFLKMEESGIPPIELTYNSLIQLYLKSKCYDDVKTLLHKMAKTYHRLDDLTFSWLLDSVAAGMLDPTTLKLIYKLKEEEEDDEEEE